MNAKFSSALVLAVAVFTLRWSTAWAHGGEDHGPPPAPTATATATEHVYAAETEIFSVVIKYPNRAEHGRLPIRVYIADASSSAPVPQATVRVELTGMPEIRATRVEAGIYAAEIPDPRAGSTVDAVVTVEGSQVDIVTIEGLTFGPPPTPRAAASTTAPTGVAGLRARLTTPVGIGAVAILGLVLLVVAAIGWRRRANRRASMAAAEVQS